MIIKEKIFYARNKKSSVKLELEEGFYIVSVDGDVYKKTANELFAMQVFNAV